MNVLEPGATVAAIKLAVLTLTEVTGVHVQVVFAWVLTEEHAMVWTNHIISLHLFGG